MNSITIKSSVVSDYRIEYEYEITGDWQKYFTKEKFYAEYSLPIKGIDESIAIIPVLGTVLPMAWVFDAKIIVSKIDKVFFEAIPEFKNGFENMYPKVKFGGELLAEEIVENKSEANKSATLFSGGVDAFDTLISHIDEKPDLVTIWGADIADDNNEAWEVVKNHRDMVCTDWGLSGVTIKSSFRKVIEEWELTKFIRPTAGDGWWHGFHHSIGMFALVAPVAQALGYSKVYVASSFTKDYIGQYTCASDPTIDNFVKFSGARVVHDGYQYSRQDKIHNICEYSGKNNIKIPLRVCWESKDGSNCCECEKCFRTMLGIYAEKKDPTKFGFDYKYNSFCELATENKSLFKFVNFRYECIQKRLRENYKINEVAPVLKTFHRTNVDKLEKKFKNEEKIKAYIKRIILKVKVIIKKVIK